eukprot:5199154-Lingulodinium_polyedra.AAC.2
MSQQGCHVCHMSPDANVLLRYIMNMRCQRVALPIITGMRLFCFCRRTPCLSVGHPWASRSVNRVVIHVLRPQRARARVRYKVCFEVVQRRGEESRLWVGSSEVA